MASPRESAPNPCPCQAWLRSRLRAVLASDWGPAPPDRTLGLSVSSSPCPHPSPTGRRSADLCQVSQPACPRTQAGAHGQPRTLGPALQGGRVPGLWTGVPLSPSAGSEMAFPALPQVGQPHSLGVPRGSQCPPIDGRPHCSLRRAWTKLLFTEHLPYVRFSSSPFVYTIVFNRHRNSLRFFLSPLDKRLKLRVLSVLPDVREVGGGRAETSALTCPSSPPANWAVSSPTRPCLRSALLGPSGALQSLSINFTLQYEFNCNHLIKALCPLKNSIIWRPGLSRRLSKSNCIREGIPSCQSVVFVGLRDPEHQRVWNYAAPPSPSWSLRQTLVHKRLQQSE